MFNWFLRLIGIPAVVNDIQSRVDRQVGTLKIENDILNEKLEQGYAELAHEVDGLRNQVVSLLEHATRPSNTDPEFQKMMTSLLAALDEDIRRFSRRLNAIEESTVTKHVTDDRIIQEIDDNSVMINTVVEQLNTLRATVAQYNELA